MNKKKSILIAILGSSLGLYNANLYGFFALFLAPLYFPLTNPLASQIAAMSAFATGFLMRPLGGILFGYIGDSHGRKSAFGASIVITTLATFIIGILPTYEGIGLVAPLILVCCLAAQGACIAGVYTGASLLVVEYSKHHKVGLACSLLPASSLMGVGMAAILGAAVMRDTMPVWAWRVPFLLSVVIGMLVFFLRHHIEAPAFKQADNHQQRQKYPLIRILKNHRRNFLCTIGINIAATAFFYIPMVYSIGLAANSQKSLSSYQSMLINAAMMVVTFIALPLMGHLSDKVGIKRLMQWGSMGAVLVSLPLFWFMHQDLSVIKVAIVMFSLMVLYASFAGPMGAFLTYLFSPQERYTGVGLGSALGGAIAGAITPVIIIFLMQLTHNGVASALYLMVCAFIGWLSVFGANVAVASSEQQVKY